MSHNFKADCNLEKGHCFGSASDSILSLNEGVLSCSRMTARRAFAAERWPTLESQRVCDTTASSGPETFGVMPSSRRKFKIATLSGRFQRKWWWLTLGRMWWSVWKFKKMHSRDHAKLSWAQSTHAPAWWATKDAGSGTSGTTVGVAASWM
mmetsp:Transcript_53940/g.73710  ORF Transcript_53940/g.73710 Transcript_53940/m.73710 type:complete len:151 (-) Transcript_53940:1092-1544(-)